MVRVLIQIRIKFKVVPLLFDKILVENVWLALPVCQKLLLHVVYMFWGRSKCPQCLASRKYYCYTCYIPLGGQQLESRVPRVRVVTVAATYHCAISRTTFNKPFSIIKQRCCTASMTKYSHLFANTPNTKSPHRTLRFRSRMLTFVITTFFSFQ